MSAKKLGADHPLTLIALNSLAGAYLYSGKTAEAVALYEQVRDMCVKKLGADRPQTLITLVCLARAYQTVGRLAEAIALFEQLRDARLRKLGADHPETLLSLYDLAEAYQAAAKPEQALPLFQQAAEGLERRHFALPQAGLIVGALTDCCEQLKHFDQAEAWRRKWLAVVKERSGADSLPYAAENAVLALNLLGRKKWVEAEAALRDCLAIRERKQPDDWTTFNTRSMLGEALNGQKKHDEAERLLLEGYEGLKQRAAKIPKEGKPRVIEAVERLVQFYDARGNQHEATRWRKELDAVKADAKPQGKP